MALTTAEQRGKVLFGLPHYHCFTLILEYVHMESFELVKIQRCTYRVLQTIQMNLIFLCVLAESAALGSTKTALKFKYEI